MGHFRNYYTHFICFGASRFCDVFIMFMWQVRWDVSFTALWRRTERRCCHGNGRKAATSARALCLVCPLRAEKTATATCWCMQITTIKVCSVFCCVSFGFLPFYLFGSSLHLYIFYFGFAVLVHVVRLVGELGNVYFGDALAQILLYTCTHADTRLHTE